MNQKRMREPHSTYPYLFLRYFLVLSLGFPVFSFAQSNYKCIQKDLADFPFVLDTLLIDPSSITVNGQTKGFTFNQNDQFISINNSFSNDAKLQICYRVASKNLEEAIYDRDLTIYEKGGYRVQENSIQRSEGYSDEFISTPGIYKMGAITRGITVGNRQDLFVNSNLNLQLSGELAEDLFLNAVITDQNIPYQPEGNTQQLRDFDNVYIELYNNKWNLLAGDFVLRSHQRNYFLKYYKNQLGFRLQKESQLNEWSLRSQLAVSSSKGKFTSTFVEAIEGVQGPYKLRGPDGERFIVVLANSERVFIDGILVERGFDKDYIIDYNIGEIVFNPSIQITRYTRIRVDYEYAQQTFPRSSVQTSHVLNKNRITFYTDYYRESDNETNPLFGNFTDSDLQNLDSLGDLSQNAFISGITESDFIPELILYERRDTLLNNRVYTYYVPSRDPQRATFQITFTDVGFGNGDYILGNSESNGRVFTWVPPDVGGQSQGNFSPIVKIVTPNRRQAGVIGNQVEITPGFTFNQELALSEQDNNLLSSRDDQDNNGMAWKGVLQMEERRIARTNYSFSGHVGYEFNSKDFRPIDRFRSIDFDRDWSYRFPNDSVNAAERIFDTRVQVSQDINNGLEYTITRRQRIGIIDGWQQQINFAKEFGPFFSRSTNFLLASDVLENQSTWTRSFNELGVGIWQLQTGLYYDLDENKVVNNSEQVVGSAMHFREQGVFLRNSDSSNFSLGIKAGTRQDNIPREGALSQSTNINKVSGLFGFSSNDNHQWTGNINFLQVEDLVTLTNEQQITGSLNANDQLFNNHIRSNLLYSTASARELRREYVFTLVGSGQGTHTWRDENNDGVQDITEFYEAINTDERNFIRLLLPTDDYIDAFQTIYRHNIDIQLPKSLRGNSGFLSALSRFAFQGNLNINNKTTSSDYVDRLVPIARSDSSNLSARNFSRFTVFFNRNEPGVGFQLNRNRRYNRFLNQNGFESLQQDEWNPHLRVNLVKAYQLDFDFLSGILTNESDFLANRNFKLTDRRYRGNLTFLLSNDHRFTVGYANNRKENVASEGNDEFSNSNEIESTYTWSKVRFGNLNLSLRLINIDFSGEENTFLGYTLLQALRPGNNATWTINWQQNLKNGLQLTMQYFGRKSEANPVVHSGTVQITAFF